MNIILFEPHEAEKGALPRGDRRVRHLLSVLRAGPGDSFAAGILNGKKGSLEILSVNAESLSFRFVPGSPPPALLPLDIIVGLPRPLVTGRLIKDLACLGLRSLHFVRATLCEKSYLSGSLWQKQEYRQHLLEGLQQSGTTLLPEVRLHERFDSCLACFSAAPHAYRASAVSATPAAAAAPGSGDSCRCVLDQRTEIFLRDIPPRGAAVLAIGPERGWIEAELEKFKTAGFLVCRMGPRILRTEAAALAASALMLSRMGYM
ncbi:MAG: 16S rRNA (uracil(1498)-N(3))-methyltransferase [Spirochaetales bacterium]|nr:16S rRNA (uracil(1498)-N(3))-methyltransferase [Spirochaetales bacterium]